MVLFSHQLLSEKDKCSYRYLVTLFLEKPDWGKNSQKWEFSDLLLFINLTNEGDYSRAQFFKPSLGNKSFSILPSLYLQNVYSIVYMLVLRWNFEGAGRKKALSGQKNIAKITNIVG